MIMERRTFVKNTALATAALGLGPFQSFAAPGMNKVKLAFIGVGLRGQAHLDNALRREDTDVVAICDIDERMLGMAANVIKKIGEADAAGF